VARSVFSSSSLLTEIMQRPLDPGYAAAARRREEQRQARAGADAHAEGPVEPPGGRRPSHRPEASRPRWSRVARRGPAVMVVVGVVLGLVAGAGVAQLRSSPLQAQDRAVLEAEVERRTALADELAETNAGLREQIEAEQAAAIGEGSSSLLAATDRLALATGAVRVRGEGVVVVMDDAPVDEVGRDDAVVDEGRVQDLDVQTVVNGLWAAGAEGIAINGQRLTALSTIRHAGDAIVVDLRQLARPYTISAVGDPRVLLEEARTGSAGRYAAVLRNNYGISVSVEAVDDVELPAASRLGLRHASSVPPTTPEDPGDDDGPAADGQS
jgi:uncharacterized protein YlxW (UPF0749 family)